MKALKTRLILNSICAFCWTLCSILSFINDSETFLKALYTFCAVIWLFLSYRTFKEYSESKVDN